jgi:salicylate hydroxylase
MRIIVSGAGLGGLVLAQALRDHAEVIVLDRDAAAGDTGGYRIALTPEAIVVLEQHLPSDALRRLRRVSDGADTFSQFTIANRRLRPIVIAPEPPGQDRMLCQRRALRQILTEGLGDRVRFSSTVVSARSRSDSAVVELSDGTQLEADLVVAADGGRSATLRSFAPETSVNTGLIGIAGSTPLRSETRLPRYLLRGPALGLDHRGTGMFLSLASHRVGEVPPELAAAIGPPSLVWGLIARGEALSRGGDVMSASPTSLAARAAVMVSAWHPWMSQMIDASDPQRTAAFAFRASNTTSPRFPWPQSRITAIGDAVHAMPPTAGRAGSTAIRSAGALAEALLETTDVDAAVSRYQARVDEWAVPAIRESLGPVRAIRALRNPAVQRIARPGLALAGAVGSLAAAVRA